METVIKYLVVFLAGLLTVLVFTPLWQRLALILGLVDKPGGRKIHSSPRPVGGGVAVFLGFHAACAAVFLLPWQPFAGQISIDWWFRFIPLSIGIVFLGLIDDRFGMRPIVKLAGQFAIAVAAYYLNIRIQNVMGINLPEWVDFFGTVLWFLAIMNAFNLIDGLDGLATGIALIAAIGIGASLLFRRMPSDVLLFVGFAGACLGFLRYNFYPARVFLGDAGSLFIGFTLAALTISTSSKGPAVAAIGVPLLAIGVPLFDSALAVWRRSIRRICQGATHKGERAEISQGDAEHLHHRLLQKDRRHDQVAWILYVATALLALTGVLTTVFNDQAIGILGIAFVITAYVVLRHLTWIEMRDTGEVVLQGLARPVRRNLTLIIYICLDLVILNLAWVASTVLVDLQDGSFQGGLKSAWLRTLPIDVALPFLLLMGARAYTQTWSLAYVVEYVKLGFAGLIGFLMTCAVHLLFLPSDESVWTVVLHQIILFGLAIPCIIGIRAVFRTIKDAMFRHASRRGEEAGGNRILAVGTGSELMLFFQHRAMQRKPSQGAIVGALTEDGALRGCYIAGVKVLGTLEQLSGLVHKEKISEVCRVGRVEEDEMARLKDRLRDRSVRLTHWSVVEEEVPL